MAYTQGNLLILVEGDTGSADMFVNTWCVDTTAGVPDPQDAVDAIHGFYEAIKDEQSAAYQALSASVKDLFTGELTEATWATVTGGDASVILPPQCAVRVSLSGPGNVQGGPFLPGWSNAANTSGGALTTTAQADIETGLTGLFAALAAADLELCIHRPTLETVVPVTRARVGRRFDVIRRRSNDNPENYVVVTP